MKRSAVVFSLLLLGILIGGGTLRLQAQFGNSPEAVAAREKQLALENNIPQLKITEEQLTSPFPAIPSVKPKEFPKIPKATCLCTRARGPAVVREAEQPPSCSRSTKP